VDDLVDEPHVGGHRVFSGRNGGGKVGHGGWALKDHKL